VQISQHLVSKDLSKQYVGILLFELIVVHHHK